MIIASVVGLVTTMIMTPAAGFPLDNPGTPAANNDAAPTEVWSGDDGIHHHPTPSRAMQRDYMDIRKLCTHEISERGMQSITVLAVPAAFFRYGAYS